MSGSGIASGAAMVAIGGSGCWAGVRSLRLRGRLVETWPTVPGRVTERGVGRPQYASGTGPPAFRWVPTVSYAYTVDGADRVGHAIYPERVQYTGTNTQQWAQRFADGIPDDVTVRYNPGDPAETFILSPRRRNLILVAVLTAAIFLTGAVVLAVSV